MGTPNLGLVIDALCAFQLTEALKGAVELEIFTHIGAGADTAAAIAKRAGASERGVRILCDYLTVREFLAKNDGRYSNTPTAAAFLDKTSKHYIGSTAFFLANERIQQNFRNMASVVRKGGAVATSTVSPDDPVWVEFARSMAPFIAMVAGTLAPHLARPGESQKVLDIAAGHGLFGLLIAKANPAATVYGTDWDRVLDVARENSAALGVADRYHTIPGDAFEVDFGSGYDLVLVPNFVHHFDPPTNVTLLNKVRRAMKPGGTVAIVEFVPNPDRVSPPFPASFSLQMLGGTDSGDAYTLRELTTMLTDAGFTEVNGEPLDPTPQTLVRARA